MRDNLSKVKSEDHKKHNCDYCGKEFELGPYQNGRWLAYCSPGCAGKNHKNVIAQRKQIRIAISNLPVSQVREILLQRRDDWDKLSISQKHQAILKSATRKAKYDFFGNRQDGYWSDACGGPCHDTKAECYSQVLRHYLGEETKKRNHKDGCFVYNNCQQFAEHNKYLDTDHLTQLGKMVYQFDYKTVNQPKVRKRAKPSIKKGVYVIQTMPDIYPQRIKVGYSGDVDKRIRQHKTTCPDLKLIGFYDNATPAQEQQVLEYLRKHHKNVGGEVFDVSHCTLVMHKIDCWLLNGTSPLKTEDPTNLK